MWQRSQKESQEALVKRWVLQCKCCLFPARGTWVLEQRNLCIFVSHSTFRLTGLLVISLQYVLQSSWCRFPCLLIFVSFFLLNSIDLDRLIKAVTISGSIKAQANHTVWHCKLYYFKWMYSTAWKYWPLEPLTNVDFAARNRPLS